VAVEDRDPLRTEPAAFGNGVWVSAEQKRPAQRIRVVIADDHPAVRAYLRELPATSETIEVVGEAADGRVALAVARRLRPGGAVAR
jgi:hypothetical protein